MPPQPLHASCVAIDGAGVLLRGPSGSGKSDIALRLIDRGAVLVADDQVMLRASSGRLYASPPAALAGLIEARGQGLLPLPFLAEAQLAVSVVLRRPEARLPEPCWWRWQDVAIPELTLDPDQPSAVARIRLWLQHGCRR